MTNKKIITIALSVAIVHFILTSVISHYIVVQIGTQMGQMVAAGLTDASDKNPAKSEEEATRIYQDMKRKRDDIFQSWKIPELLISLPAKPLMNPLLKELRQSQINKFLAKQITRDQFRTQGLLIDYAAILLNSLSFGFLVFIVMKILNQNKVKITRGST